MLYIHLRLGLPSGLFPYGCLTNNLYTFLFSPIRATCPAHLILLDCVMFQNCSIQSELNLHCHICRMTAQAVMRRQIRIFTVLAFQKGGKNK
jgi:hypothetical protein